MLKVYCVVIGLLMGTNLFAASLEERVSRLEDRVDRLDRGEPTQVKESSCLMSVSTCVTYMKHGWVYYKYSYRQQDNIAFIYPNGTITRLTQEVAKQVDSYPNNDYINLQLAEEACMNAIDLLRYATPDC